ncbi:hypothetical protein FNF29_06486 [Cafeteria roenbergensis]|uniref:Uncharacterized protein n=1 Tax=Cafeteria roenbergensis TaxID=33653 RepID=A0A5A8C7S5_CAFRO|nr:hypothetical protein FNF29_06486 [Cafeteria roenbergensis]|eukprot:KAA0148704.1 hypothetical protein FNF29_06486 [Cafeteria roenbergensis]
MDLRAQAAGNGRSLVVAHNAVTVAVLVQPGMPPATVRRLIAARVGSGVSPKSILGVQGQNAAGETVVIPMSSVCEAPHLLDNIRSGAATLVLRRSRGSGSRARAAPDARPMEATAVPPPPDVASPPTAPAPRDAAPSAPSAGPAASVSRSPALAPEHERVLEGMVAAVASGEGMSRELAPRLAAGLRGEGPFGDFEELRLVVSLSEICAARPEAAAAAHFTEACIGTLMAAARRAETGSDAAAIPGLALAARARGADLATAMEAAMAHAKASPALRAQAVPALRHAVATGHPLLRRALLRAIIDGSQEDLGGRLWAVARAVAAEQPHAVAPPASAEPAEQARVVAPPPSVPPAASAPPAAAAAAAAPAAAAAEELEESCIRAAAVAEHLRSLGVIGQEDEDALKQAAADSDPLMAAAWTRFCAAVDGPDGGPAADAARARYGTSWQLAVALGHVAPEGEDSEEDRGLVAHRRRLWLALKGIASAECKWRSIHDSVPGGAAAAAASAAGGRSSSAAAAASAAGAAAASGEEDEEAGSMDLEAMEQLLAVLTVLAKNAVLPPQQVRQLLVEMQKDSSATRNRLVAATRRYMDRGEDAGAFSSLVEAVVSIAQTSLGVVDEDEDEEDEDEADEEEQEQEDGASEGAAEHDDGEGLDGEMPGLLATDDWPSATAAQHIESLQNTVVEALLSSGQLTEVAAARLGQALRRRDPALRAVWRTFLSTSDTADLVNSITVLVAMRRWDEEDSAAGGPGSATHAAGDQDEDEDEDEEGSGRQDDAGADQRQAEVSRLLLAGDLSDEQAAVLAALVGRGDPRALAALDDLALAPEGDAVAVEGLRCVADLCIEDPAFADRYGAAAQASDDEADEADHSGAVAVDRADILRAISKGVSSGAFAQEQALALTRLVAAGDERVAEATRQWIKSGSLAGFDGLGQ